MSDAFFLRDAPGLEVGNDSSLVPPARPRLLAVLEALVSLPDPRRLLGWHLFLHLTGCWTSAVGVTTPGCRFEWRHGDARAAAEALVGAGLFEGPVPGRGWTRLRTARCLPNCRPLSTCGGHSFRCKELVGVADHGSILWGDLPADVVDLVGWASLDPAAVALAENLGAEVANQVAAVGGTVASGRVLWVAHRRGASRMSEVLCGALGRFASAPNPFLDEALKRCGAALRNIRDMGFALADVLDDGTPVLMAPDLVEFDLCV